MDFEFLKMCVQLIISLGFVLGLMFLTFNVLNSKKNIFNNNKYIRVIDRTQITKENSIVLVKIGNKGYVITSTQMGMEKLQELSEKEINEIEEEKRKNIYNANKSYSEFYIKLKEKILCKFNNLRSKEDKDEK